ncbi:MAG TPA: isoprenylcysteine carboxyl methyltransferase [Coxiellaceae bacterium]|nr:MAG: isoprenylcysteine carboxyl methyltransferase [Gammaproteobacteria bacterium RBG_16_37_9]HBC71923.1 isoprenylcysteine carboxyl methyltransferase [Coxiellaceae bacterium]HBS51822.1 isoprenylcysteine carboxyl methyltransferase [Coxiellaceae bacterium]HBY55919.1 isoprenylcysteine carboxyl methyltransferase [Coxiellaceae bacterium]
MMNDTTNGYGLWFLVALNSAIFIVFAFSFYRPKTKRDWRSFGVFAAFIIALFTEMYGFPLTIYFLSSWLLNRYPNINLYGHNAGHLWETIFGLRGNPHFNILHILSNILIFAGFILLATAWRVLYAAQRNHKLATTGVYAKIRHPQYAAFIIIMIGFLLQWPTIITLLMFPILVWFYIRLAKKEEQDALEKFGEQYKKYIKATPKFIPNLK